MTRYMLDMEAMGSAANLDEATIRSLIVDGTEYEWQILIFLHRIKDTNELRIAIEDAEERCGEAYKVRKMDAKTTISRATSRLNDGCTQEKRKQVTSEWHDRQGKDRRWKQGSMRVTCAAEGRRREDRTDDEVEVGRNVMITMPIAKNEIKNDESECSTEERTPGENENEPVAVTNDQEMNDTDLMEGSAEQTTLKVREMDDQAGTIVRDTNEDDEQQKMVDEADLMVEETIAQGVAVNARGGQMNAQQDVDDERNPKRVETKEPGLLKLIEVVKRDKSEDNEIDDQQLGKRMTNDKDVDRVEIELEKCGEDVLMVERAERQTDPDESHEREMLAEQGEDDDTEYGPILLVDAIMKKAPGLSSQKRRCNVGQEGGRAVEVRNGMFEATQFDPGGMDTSNVGWEADTRSWTMCSTFDRDGQGETTREPGLAGDDQKCQEWSCRISRARG